MLPLLMQLDRLAVAGAAAAAAAAAVGRTTSTSTPPGGGDAGSSDSARTITYFHRGYLGPRFSSVWVARSETYTGVG